MSFWRPRPQNRPGRPEGLGQQEATLERPGRGNAPSTLVLVRLESLLGPDKRAEGKRAGHVVQ